MQTRSRRIQLALPFLPLLIPLLSAQQFRSNVPVPLAQDEQVVFAGDLDGDGLADLVVAVFGYTGTQVLTNLGSGRFLRQSLQPTAVPAVPQAWSTADIDGDGDQDLVGSQAGVRPFLLRNDRTALVDVTSTNLSAPNAVLAGRLRFLDIDGDGDPDIVGVAPYQPLQVYLNDGTGRFAQVWPSNQPAMPASPDDAIPCDLDGDGAQDLLVVTFTGPLLFMQRQGVFVDESATRLPALPGFAIDATPIDTDCDGDLDLALACSMPASQAAARLLQNLGNGVFVDVTAQQMPALVGDLVQVYPIDFDADGAADLVFEVSGQPQVLLHNQGGLGFAIVATGWQGDLYPGATALGIIDLDGDRFPDLHTVGGLLRNLGGRSLQSLTTNPFVDAVALADVDGDGACDALALDGIWRNEDGRFRRDNNLPVSRVTATGDLDGDGDLDLVTVGAGGLEVRVNDGQGNFTTAGVLPVLAMLNGLALGDVDGDGDLDVVTANGLGVSPLLGQNRLFLNDGAGHFTDATATNMPAWLGGSTSVSLGDADGDGDLDLVFTVPSVAPASPRPTLRLYLNQGNGVFVDQSQLVLSTMTTVNYGGVTQFAQLDADPELEIVQTYASAMRIFDRVGSNWQDVSASRLPASGLVATRFMTMDFDEDGDLDLVERLSFYGMRLLANDGRGTFTDVTAARGDGLLDLGPAADLDGDGDIDILVGHFVLLNQQRQLTLPLPPRPGHASILEYVAEPGFGSASHLALVGLSLDRQAHPATRPLGTFFLGSGVIYAGMLSNQGSTATAPLAVPANPALSGLALYLQGIDLTLPSGAVHLTNLIATRIE